MKFKSYFNNSIYIIKNNVYRDKRGFFYESYNKINFYSIGIKLNFIQDNHSFSDKIGTLRGLHFQTKPFEQAKLLSVIKGKVLDVVIDIRPNSKYFGKYKSFIISDKNKFQIFISKGFAHGFITLEKNTEITYKVSNYYSKQHERTIYWNDPNLNINWKYNKKILISKKDRDQGFFFNEIKNYL